MASDMMELLKRQHALLMRAHAASHGEPNPLLAEEMLNFANLLMAILKADNERKATT